MKKEDIESLIKSLDEPNFFGEKIATDKGQKIITLSSTPTIVESNVEAFQLTQAGSVKEYSCKLIYVDRLLITERMQKNTIESVLRQMKKRMHQEASSRNLKIWGGTFEIPGTSGEYLRYVENYTDTVFEVRLYAELIEE